MRSRAWLGLLALAVAPAVALAITAMSMPLPDALQRGAPVARVRVLDRDGRALHDVALAPGEVGTPVLLDEVSPYLVQALVAAEDARFRSHPGVDPLAIGRATAQLVWHRHIVSGASTLTQQLARTVVPRPRTLAGKIREAALALRIEASLDKDRILEEYFNRVEFGPNVRGVEAASQLYFGKPASRLSLAESAALAAMPRGPTLYDPRRNADRLHARRDRILATLERRGAVSSEAAALARAEPLNVAKRFVDAGAHHVAQALALGALASELHRTGTPVEITATLDRQLQREVEALVRRTTERLDVFDASSAAVVVVDNATGDVLAYVGSPDFFAERALGQNDGARALRQPGSTLKPFVYAAALETLGMNLATILPDIELHLPTEHGDYSPRNYDGKYHGPVRLRDALGSSLNVPAAYVASRVGPETALSLLHRFGFESLDQPAAHYGAGLALGDGEVRLTELAAAYSTLARGGMYKPLRFARRVRHLGAERVIPDPPGRRVLDARFAALLTDVLADDAARMASFGRNSVLAFPYPVAVKTGTSKAYRDNWTVGYTHAVTVAVWVGNFDGHPMRGSSGVTGAAPLFRGVLLAAQRPRGSEPLVDPAGLTNIEICTESGARASDRCPHRIRELFVPSHAPGVSCALHAIAGEAPGPPPRAGKPALAFPFDGAEFVEDPALPSEQQAIVLRARADDAATEVDFVLDGKHIARVGAPHSFVWHLSPGDHLLQVEAGGRVSDPVRFAVR